MLDLPSEDTEVRQVEIKVSAFLPVKFRWKYVV